MTNRTKKPEFATEEELEEYLEYLDYLRDSGETNMFAAAPYLSRAYHALDLDKAGEILLYWMNTFSERHSK